MAASFAGLLAGRLSSLAFDDPQGILRLRDVMIIRGGVEFWPGLAVGLLTWIILTRGEPAPVAIRVAIVTPLFLLGYAGYEAACILRDGCFGPQAAVGIVPRGFATPMLPIGWAVAVAVGSVAILLQIRRPAPTHGPLGLLALAAVRSVAGFHLPRLAHSLTRPHIESLGLVVVALAMVLGTRAGDRHTTPRRSYAAERTTTVSDTDPLPSEGL